MGDNWTKIVTKRDIIRGVRQKFIGQYAHYSDETVIGPSNSRTAVGDTRRRLAALDLETCTEADVDHAVGVTGWASLECDSCGQNVDVLARIGQEPDYEARWVDMCLPCLRKSIALLESSEANPEPPPMSEPRMITPAGVE